MSALDIHMFPCLSDNYGFLIHCPETGACASIDTPEAAAIEAALKDKGWRLTHILNTHHHFDHVGANLELKESWGCEIVGPKADAERIPGLDTPLADGERFRLGNAEAVVFDTPGHTKGHIAYYFAESAAAFVGDTLFALGCGRLFEGDPAQMWASLQKLMALPDATAVYCAHEYTQANARFALSVDPNNPALVARCADIDAARAKGEPTVPTRIDIEKATNPFLRPTSESLQESLSMAGASAVDVFAETRRRKDVF